MYIFYCRKIDEVWICDSPEKFIELYNLQFYHEFRWESKISLKDNSIYMYSPERGSSIVFQFKKLENNSKHDFTERF